MPEKKGRRPGWAIENTDFSFLTLDEILRTEPGSLGEILHIISLRSFKQALGDEWAQYVDKVQLIAESVVRRHVGRKGMPGRQGDDTFVLSFSSMDRDDAHDLCTAIAVDFMKILIGERFRDAAIRLGSVPRDRVVRADGTLDLDAMEAAIDEATPNVLNADGELVVAPQRNTAVSLVADAVAEERAEHEMQAAEAASQSGPQWRPLVWPPPGLKRPQALNIPPIEPGDEMPEGMALGYRAVWNARSAVISCYRVLAVGPADAAAEVAEYPLPEGASPWRRINQSFAVLFYALTQIERNIEARRALELIVQLPYAATRAPAATILEDLLGYFPGPARARHLYLELVEIPDEADEASVANVVRRLKALVRDVLVSCHGKSGPVRLDLLTQALPRAIGYDLSTRDQADSIRFISQFAKALGSISPYFWGVKPGTEFAAARAGGGLFVNADAARPKEPMARKLLAEPTELSPLPTA